MNEDTLRKLLLGQLQEEARERAEAELFLEASGPERVDALRAELVEAYREGALPPEDRAAVQRRLAEDPRWQSELRFSEALTQRASERPSDPALRPRRSPWLSGLMVGAFAASAAVVLLAPSGAPVLLEASAVRAAGTVAQIDRSAYRADIPVQVRLPAEETAPAFRVDLRLGDEAVWSSRPVAPEEDGELHVQIPRERLDAGLYTLEVRSANTDEVVARISIRVR